jgi:hypothetical protein
MTRLSILIAILLAGQAQAVEVPDEATKVAALKIAFILNGYSMVRWGSIDLTRPPAPPEPFEFPLPTTPKGDKR